jgi:hypothetical protein
LTGIARIGDIKIHIQFWQGDLKEGDYFEVIAITELCSDGDGPSLPSL